MKSSKKAQINALIGMQIHFEISGEKNDDKNKCYNVQKLKRNRLRKEYDLSKSADLLLR